MLMPPHQYPLYSPSPASEAACQDVPKDGSLQSQSPAHVPNDARHNGARATLDVDNSGSSCASEEQGCQCSRSAPASGASSTFAGDLLHLKIGSCKGAPVIPFEAFWMHLYTCWFKEMDVGNPNSNHR